MFGRRSISSARASDCVVPPLRRRLVSVEPQDHNAFRDRVIDVLRRLIVDEQRADAKTLALAIAAIRGGEVVAIPTDTLYGLAVDPFQPEAVARLFEMKGRPLERAVPLIAADSDQVHERIGELSPVARQLAARFWPGPLTLLVACSDRLAAVAGGTGKVAVRVPAHAVARVLCAACDAPLTATSANLSGEPPSADPDEVARSLAGRLDVLVDSGILRGGQPSTIVDATSSAPVLVRAGAIAWVEIQRFLSGDSSAETAQ